MPTSRSGSSRSRGTGSGSVSTLPLTSWWTARRSTTGVPKPRQPMSRNAARLDSPQRPLEGLGARAAGREVLLEERPMTAEGKDLEVLLRKQIVERTSGRVQRLEVRIDEGHVRVKGCVPTYHVRQLAHLAVVEVLGRQTAT